MWHVWKGKDTVKNVETHVCVHSLIHARKIERYHTLIDLSVGLVAVKCGHAMARHGTPWRSAEPLLSFHRFYHIPGGSTQE